MTDYLTAFSNVITTVVFFFNSIKPEKAKDFPHNLIIYGFHMFVPFAVVFLMSSMYYIRQPLLRKTVYREVKNLIEMNYNQ